MLWVVFCLCSRLILQKYNLEGVIWCSVTLLVRAESLRLWVSVRCFSYQPADGRKTDGLAKRMDLLKTPQNDIENSQKSSKSAKMNERSVTASVSLNSLASFGLKNELNTAREVCMYCEGKSRKIRSRKRRNPFRSNLCDYKSNVSRMNESPFLAKWFAENRGFKTVPPKCGCNKVGSCIFLEFSDHEKKSHHVFSDNRLGARTCLANTPFACFLHRGKRKAPKSTLSSPRGRGGARKRRKIEAKDDHKDPFYNLFYIRVKVSSRDHNLSLPIFTNSKIKNNRLQRLSKPL